MFGQQQLFFSFIIPFVSSVLGVFLTIKFAHRHKIYDSVNERKVHTGAIPRLGGVGIFIAFIFSFVLASRLLFNTVSLAVNDTVLIIAGALIFSMGVSDDLKPWRALFKLLVQCFATSIVVFAGFRFSRISYMPLNLYWSLGWFSYPLTFLWILGVTNAVNLIDGIDGQAGTISFLVLIDYSIIFFLLNNYTAMSTCLIFASAIAGFLVFNLPFPEARIFMGDGGSQFLGFMLATIPLIRLDDAQESIALPYSFILLLIPIADTFATIWRRLREKRPLRHPDRFHLHHKLMLMVYSPRVALVIVVILQSIINLLVGVAVMVSGEIGLILLLSVVLIVILFFTVIHYKKEEIIKRQ